VVEGVLVKPSKDKKLNPAGKLADKMQGASKEKMIRLDDLIPKQDVKGGRRVFFGGKDLKSTNDKPKGK
jgi:hypothetical protein